MLFAMHEFTWTGTTTSLGSPKYAQLNYFSYCNVRYNVSNNFKVKPKKISILIKNKNYF